MAKMTHGRRVNGVLKSTPDTNIKNAGRSIPPKANENAYPLSLNVGRSMRISGRKRNPDKMI